MHLTDGNRFHDLLDFPLDDRRFVFWDILPPAPPDRLAAIRAGRPSPPTPGRGGSSWTNSGESSTGTTTTGRSGHSARRPGTSSRCGWATGSAGPRSRR